MIYSALAVLGAGSAMAQVGGQYNLEWNTLDGGGATISSAGQFALGATAGQADAIGGVYGGRFGLVGGFWAVHAPPALRGDMNCDGLVNNFDIDPFVQALVDLAAWHAAFPGCNNLNGDINADGLLNNFDIDPFVECMIQFGCP